MPERPPSEDRAGSRWRPGERETAAPSSAGRVEVSRWSDDAGVSVGGRWLDGPLPDVAALAERLATLGVPRPEAEELGARLWARLTGDP